MRLLLLLCAFALVLSACEGDDDPAPITPTFVTVTGTTAPGDGPESTPTALEPSVHNFGILNVNNQPAPDGAPLQVRAGQQICAESRVVTLGGQATYAFDVPIGCGGNQPWEMYIAGILVGELPKQGGRQDFALIFGGEGQPTEVPTETVTEVPEETATATAEPEVTTTP